jgi:hypothetical protein
LENLKGINHYGDLAVADNCTKAVEPKGSDLLVSKPSIGLNAEAVSSPSSSDFYDLSLKT